MMCGLRENEYAKTLASATQTQGRVVLLLLPLRRRLLLLRLPPPPTATSSGIDAQQLPPHVAAIAHKAPRVWETCGSHSRP